jgi:hypothetical protein
VCIATVDVLHSLFTVVTHELLVLTGQESLGKIIQTHIVNKDFLGLSCTQLAQCLFCGLVKADCPEVERTGVCSDETLPSPRDECADMVEQIFAVEGRYNGTRLEQIRMVTHLGKDMQSDNRSLVSNVLGTL